MTEQLALDVARNALTVTLELAAPLLLVSLAVGMAVSVFQAITQINEATLTFVPKIVAVGATIAVLGPWMATTLVTYAVNVFSSLPSVAH